MAVMSTRPGDQVTLTSVLHEFKEPVSVRFDYRLQGSTPETDGTLSVYLLSKQRVPQRLYLTTGADWQNDLPRGWKTGRFNIPSGSYHVMFLATLGLPYRSDIYLDTIVVSLCPHCFRWLKPATGNILFLLEILSVV